MFGSDDMYKKVVIIGTNKSKKSTLSKMLETELSNENKVSIS